MKAEPDKKRAISIIAGNLKYADAPRNLDRALDAACAPVVKQRDELLAEVEQVERLKELVDYSDGLCEDCGRNLYEDEPKESYLHNWWKCGSCLNAQFHDRVDRADKAESLARELLTALVKMTTAYHLAQGHAVYPCRAGACPAYEVLIRRATEQLGETT